MNLINILQGLGSNDQSIREKHLSQLSTYLKNQTTIKEEGTSTRIEKYLHTWNAIFYFFWNTDKPIVQKASATQIANLLYSIKDKSNFILTCFDSFNSKWSKIDFLRLDKYIMLMDTVYALFYNYVLLKKKYKLIKLLFEGVRRISTMNSLYILKNDKENDHIKSSNKCKIDYSSFAKYVNFSFFRNFTKNIGVYIDVISKDNEALLSLFKLFGILPKRESELFQELVLNKLYKHILLFDNKRKNEIKEILNSLLSQSQSNQSEIISNSSESSKYKLAKKFTFYGITCLRILYEKVFSVGLSHKSDKKMINNYEYDNDDNNDENGNSIFNEVNIRKKTSNKNNPNSYSVDPIKDSILQRNYLTKFRMSNVEKMKMLSEKNKVNKALEDEKKKLEELKRKNLKGNLNGKQIEYDQVTIKLNEEVNDEDIDEYQSDFESLSNEESDIEEELKEIGVDKENVNDKKKLDEIAVKEKNFLNEKRKLSNNSTSSVKDKENDKEKPKASCVLFNPKVNSPVKVKEDIKSKQEEIKIKHVDIKKIETKPVELNIDEVNDEILSDLDENDVDFNFKVEDNRNKKLNDKDKDKDKNVDIDVDEEDEDDDEEYEDYDDYEGEEGEEGEEFEDDLEDFEDILMDEESISKLPKKQQMFIAQLMQPPDFKKDLFKKGAGDNEVDYKSLKLAIENSNSNMRFFKNLKKEEKYKKKGKGLLGSGDKSKVNVKKMGRKVKFDTYISQVKKFDKKTTILLESVRSKTFEILPIPLKGCLKKK